MTREQPRAPGTDRPRRAVPDADAPEPPEPAPIEPDGRPGPDPMPSPVRPGASQPGEARSPRFGDNPLALLMAACGMCVPMAIGVFLPELPSWIAGVVVWAAILGLSVSPASPLARFWRGRLDQVSRNTGLYGWAFSGLVLAGAMGVAVGLAQAWSQLVLSAAFALGFGRLILLGPQQRQSHRLPVPDGAVWDEDDAPDGSDDPDLVERVFAWTVSALTVVNDHRESTRVSKSAYARLRAANPFSNGARPANQTMALWVTEGHSADVVRAAAMLRRVSIRSGYSSFAEMSSVLALAQSVKYMSDDELRGQPEFWQYPVETLFDCTGDCEDTSILTAALLRELGHGVVLLLLPSHAAVGIKAPPGVAGDFVQFRGERYFYGETTAEGWRIGDMPTDYADVDVEILPVSYPVRGT